MGAAALPVLLCPGARILGRRLTGRGPASVGDVQPLTGSLGFAGFFAGFAGLGGLTAAWLELDLALQGLFAVLSGAALGGFLAVALRVHRELPGARRRLPWATGPVRLQDTGPPGALLARSTEPLQPGDHVLIVAAADGQLEVQRLPSTVKDTQPASTSSRGR